MNTYYISLVRGLNGCYVKIVAPSENAVRKYCANYMGKMWCSIYTELKPQPFCNCVIINQEPIVIEEDGLYE